MRLELPEHFGKEPCRLTGMMRSMEVIPHRRKRRPEIAQQLGEHLADGLRLARQLRQIVTIIDRPLPDTFARMHDAGAIATEDHDRRRTDACDQIEPGPPTRHRVHGALESHERAW